MHKRLGAQQYGVTGEKIIMGELNYPHQLYLATTLTPHTVKRYI